MVAAPFDLFVSFLLCPTVSKGIFDTWDCTKYELDGATGEVRTFLKADLQIVCGGNDYPEEYDQINNIAYFFLLIWPIGMPLIYMLVLFPNRQALRQGRKTRMVQATAFLHKEYNPTVFWWEIVTLQQRLILTGWVLLIPIENDVWRIFLGLLTTIGYLSLIQFVQPYKRKGFNTLATAAQFSLVCVFLGGAFIKLFSGDGVDSATCNGAAASNTNDDSVFKIVCIMAVYARIAVAFFTGQHRVVSMCLLAREIGAVRHNMIKACVGGALTRLADAMDTNQRGSAAELEGSGGVAAKNNAAWCNRQIAAEEERRSHSRRLEISGISGMPADTEEEHATTEGPLVAPAPEAAQGRNSFSQASSSAVPRSSGGSRGGSPRGMSPRGGSRSPRFSGGPRFAGARPAVVTPAGDETDGESGSDSQASASCDHTQCPRSYTV